MKFIYFTDIHLDSGIEIRLPPSGDLSCVWNLCWSISLKS